MRDVIYSITYFSQLLETDGARFWRSDLDEAVELATRKGGEIVAYTIDKEETEYVRMLLDKGRES